MFDRKLYELLREMGWDHEVARRAVERYVRTGDEEMIWYDPDELS
jgi:hypothetical protein